MMKFQIAATQDVMKDLTSESIIYMTEHFGLDYWRRRRMLVLQGCHILIRWPDDRTDDLGKVQIGEVYL